MGAVTATNGLIERDFSCEQHALLGYALPPGWVQVKNTCGQYLTKFLTPFASTGIDLSGSAVKGRWHLQEATVGAVNTNRVMLPGSFLLPAEAANVRLVVRRQQYMPSEAGAARDFAVNTDQNSLDLDPAKTGNLNGQRCTVEVFK